jgi:hypothetical protein
VPLNQNRVLSFEFFMEPALKSHQSTRQGKAGQRQRNEDTFPEIR